MKEMPIGIAIRQRRLAMGWTQEELCDGICEPSTLSHIENGLQFPRPNTAKALLRKLDLPDERYCSLFADDTAGILRQEIENYRYQSARAAEGRKDALKKLSELESIATDIPRVRQYILAARADLGKEDGLYEPGVQLDMLLEAIRLTVPHFSPELVPVCLYDPDEISIICQIGSIYSLEGNHKKAAGFFHQLLSCLTDQAQNILYPSRIFPLVFYHYAHELLLLGYCQDAFDAAEKGRQCCLDYGYSRYLPNLLILLARCSCLLEQEHASKEYYQQAYYFFLDIDRPDQASAVQAEMSGSLGIPICL